MATTHTSCFRQILNPLFDLYYVLEIITFGNYNGLDAGPLTLLSPYILSLVNANGPTHVIWWTASGEVRVKACVEQYSLQWRHNGLDSVSNHKPHDCLFNHLFRRRSKKTSKLRVIVLCAGNSPVTDELPVQMASYAEKVSIWWRHDAFLTRMRSVIQSPSIWWRHHV